MRQVPTSIHASYANDATRTQLQRFQIGYDFNPRIVRKRCDSAHTAVLERRRDFNPRIVRKRCDVLRSSLRSYCRQAFQSTHRTQTMRLRYDADENYINIISIHASYANDATVNYAATAISSIFQSTHRTQTMRQEIDTKRSRVSKFQSTHRTQTMRPASELQAAILATFQSTHRTQTMRRDYFEERSVGLSISIHASYANDATQNGCVKYDNDNISIHASYANDATSSLFYGVGHSDRFQSTHRTQTMRPLLSLHSNVSNDFNPRIVRKRCDL